MVTTRRRVNKKINLKHWLYAAAWKFIDDFLEVLLNCQNSTLRKRIIMLFGHVARLDATTPAHQILKQVIAVKSGYQSDAVWRRAPGRPRNSWIMQIGNGSPLSIRRERKTAQDHGHHGESSQRTSAVFASWWWWWLLCWVDDKWQYSFSDEHQTTEVTEHAC